MLLFVYLKLNTVNRNIPLFVIKFCIVLSIKHKTENVRIHSQHTPAQQTPEEAVLPRSYLHGNAHTHTHTRLLPHIHIVKRGKQYMLCSIYSSALFRVTLFTDP